MQFVSPLVDLTCRVLGPRLAFRVLLRRMDRWRTFEPEYFLLDRVVDPGRAGIDVGGNEGYYAGRLAQLCPRVHCFEPIPWLADALRQKLPRSVVVHNAALSNRAGEAVLRVPYAGDEEKHGSSTLEGSNSLSGEGYTSTREVPCRLQRLDDVVHEPVGFVKMDVEGHELAALTGAEGLLRRDRPVLLIESDRRHHPGAPANLFRLLQGWGYEGFFLDAGRLRPVAEFNADAFQRRENLFGAGGPYVNNFFFCARPFPDGFASLAGA